ncbi:MAG: amino acid permease, partial [Gordonibacter sp.]
VISFFPTSSLDAQANMVYQTVLGVAFVVSIVIPFVIYGMRHRWVPKDPVAAVSASFRAPGAASATSQPLPSDTLNVPPKAAPKPGRKV